jgi:hypothetical protein
MRTGRAGHDCAETVAELLSNATINGINNFTESQHFMMLLLYAT